MDAAVKLDTNLNLTCPTCCMMVENPIPTHPQDCHCGECIKHRAQVNITDKCPFCRNNEREEEARGVNDATDLTSNNLPDNFLSQISHNHIDREKGNYVYVNLTDYQQKHKQNHFITATNREVIMTVSHQDLSPLLQRPVQQPRYGTVQADAEYISNKQILLIAYAFVAFNAMLAISWLVYFLV